MAGLATWTTLEIAEADRAHNVDVPRNDRKMCVQLSLDFVASRADTSTAVGRMVAILTGFFYALTENRQFGGSNATLCSL